MIRVALHDKVSDILVDRRLLGDLRTTGACYTVDGVAEPGDDPNPSFCVRHTALDTFDVSNQELSPTLTSAMVSVLEANPGVRYINFAGSNVGELLDNLSPIFKCPNLRLYSLNLSFCKLGTIGFKKVAEALLSMVHPISELSVVGNDLDSNDMKELRPWLEGNTALKLLDLGLNAKISSAGLLEVSTALALAGHPLQSLGLSSIGLQDSDSDLVAQLILHEQFKAEFLDLSWNVMGVDSPGNMAAILGRCRTVRELHIMAMKFGLVGGKRLFHSFEGNTTIEVLHLGSNYIPAIEEVGQFIAATPSLRWLDFVSNLTECFVFSPFLNQSSLTILSLCNTNIANRIETLATLLTTNTTLLELHLNFNNMSDHGASLMASALHQNSTLLNLRLDENEISESGIEALFEALKTNSTLHYLDISENDFDPIQFEHITFPAAPNRFIRFYAN
jgi:hypothetical protein